MGPELALQNPEHQHKRLRCACGSWNWKIEEHEFLPAANFVCAECGAVVRDSYVNDLIRKKYEIE